MMMMMMMVMVMVGTGYKMITFEMMKPLPVHCTVNICSVVVVAAAAFQH
jgi:hypothetical protein